MTSALVRLPTPLRRWSILGMCLLAIGTVVTGCDSGNTPTSENTVADIVSLSQNSTALADALEQADLAADLSDEDTTFTVFAPVDSAFGNIDQEELTEDSDMLSEVLTYHVVPGKALTSGQITDGQTVETMAGDSLTLHVNNESVRANDASVTTPNLEGTNGVVHLVDGVLLETVDAVDRTKLTPRLSIFGDLVEQSELTAALRQDNLTVFSPTNQVVLDALDENENDEIDDDEVPNNLGEIVQYHVVEEAYFADDVPSSAIDRSTLEGSTVTLKRSDGTVTVNDATVINSDIGVENGVLHDVDSVLYPPTE
ncbi:putative surface protein with fasciclin (FAS1) repeats [Salinibacter ruber]|nr:putative surface protein with fasciclin (FAS1) repeats [Salinibacter ruber]